MGERLHEIIVESAPGLTPRVWYGMPWYFRDGKSWCFFRAATKFNFIFFGFDDPAKKLCGSMCKFLLAHSVLDVQVFTCEIRDNAEEYNEQRQH